MLVPTDVKDVEFQGQCMIPPFFFKESSIVNVNQHQMQHQPQQLIHQPFPINQQVNNISNICSEPKQTNLL